MNRCKLYIMLLGWVMICAGLPARAQTSEKAANLVDTAAAFARLRSVSASTLIGPAQEGAAADGASREETAPSAPPSAVPDEPKFQLTPYIWFSGFKGNVGARGYVAQVDAKFVDLIDELNFGALVAFEAKWGRWKFLADTVYMNLSDDKATPGPLFSGAQVTSKTFIFDPELGYSVAGSEAASLDVMGGFRVWHLDNSLELRQGDQRVRASRTQTWVDPVVGMRLKASLSRAVFVTAKADVGGFGIGSDLTFQLFGGLGLNLSPRLTTVIGYRHLDVDYRRARTDFVYDVALSGLVAGFGFRF